MPINLFSLVYRRISIVNYTGEIVLDTYVAPTMPVTDYRTATTGISAEHLNSGWCCCRISVAPHYIYSCPVVYYSAAALAFNTIQQHVANKIKGKIIVGHSLWNDLSGTSAKSWSFYFDSHFICPQSLAFLTLPLPPVMWRCIFPFAMLSRLRTRLLACRL